MPNAHTLLLTPINRVSLSPDFRVGSLHQAEDMNERLRPGLYR